VFNCEVLRGIVYNVRNCAELRGIVQNCAKSKGSQWVKSTCVDNPKIKCQCIKKNNIKLEILGCKEVKHILKTFALI